MAKIMENTTGFAFAVRGKDFFVVTDQKRKTSAFAGAVLAAMNASGEVVRDAEAERAALVQMMRPAVLEVKQSKCGEYYDIHGENFGGWGSFVDDGKTVVLFV